MPHNHSTLTKVRHFCRAAATSVLCIASKVSATSVYSGGGPQAGVTATNSLTGIPTTGDPRSVIVSVLNSILNYMALLAVLAVIVAGIYLIVGMGSDDSREKAKKIILYTLIGLVIILLSQIIVGLVTVYVASQV